MYIWIFCSLCCKHDATNGASDRLLTFLAVSLCVCVKMQQHLFAISMAHQVHMHSLHWNLSRSVKQNRVRRAGSDVYIYIWIFCSICCKHDATNGASGRLLTFLAVSLCVFKCSNIHCHFHGSSGAHALASLKTQQKCQVEQGQMYIWIYDATVSMVHQVQMQSLSLKTQQTCSRNQQTLSSSSVSSGEPAEVVI